GLAPPAPCRSPGAPVSKRAQAKNSQNCFLYWLLPTVVASAIGFQIDEIEMEFLQENSSWEFSHSLGQKAKYSLRAHIVRLAPESGLKSDLAGGPFRAISGHCVSSARLLCLIPIVE